ncbi:hypothetical protein ACIQU6_38845 [Streptomyces sp. NPDC090442]|uniref:hypothetical protein n=1 Tax=Streptomyces sp. NPDC090442 TaxID=3365962 RepID=UPI0037F6A0EA
MNQEPPVIPAAALAVVRAAVETVATNSLANTGALACQIVDELAAQGWTVTHAPSPANATPAHSHTC